MNLYTKYFKNWNFSKAGVRYLNQRQQQRSRACKVADPMQPDLKGQDTGENKTNFWNMLCINHFFSIIALMGISLTVALQALDVAPPARELEQNPYPYRAPYYPAPYYSGYLAPGPVDPGKDEADEIYRENQHQPGR